MIKTPNQLAYSRAYSRGYSAASRRRWPEHKPPEPPNEIVARLMKAARALRDAVDGQLALFDEDDPLQKTLGGPVDEVDEALIEIGLWLKSPEPNPARPKE